MLMIEQELVHAAVIVVILGIITSYRLGVLVERIRCNNLIEKCPSPKSKK